MASGTEDQEYVKSVVNGSRNLLKTVVDGLRPDDLSEARPSADLSFRIISGAMFLLKTFCCRRTEERDRVQHSADGPNRRCFEELRCRRRTSRHPLRRHARAAYRPSAKPFHSCPTASAPASDGKSPGGTHLEAQTPARSAPGTQSNQPGQERGSWALVKYASASIKAYIFL